VNERNALIEDALGRLKVDRFNERAWADLYDNVVPRARAIAYRVLAGDSTAAQDAVHDALERLMRYTTFDRFSSADEFLRYFTMMVHRTALDTRKRQDSDPAINQTTFSDPTGEGEALLDASEQIPDDSADPEAALSFKRAIRDLSSSLSPRELLVCTLLADGYDRSELAVRLGTSEPTAAVIVHRLRARLRELGHQPRGTV
jgi:RNA polymerase sigma factor (sigma-70 family)